MTGDRIAHRLAWRWHCHAWAKVEKEAREHLGDDTTDDCGGWTWDPPCGGCTRCQWAQLSYGFNKTNPLEAYVNRVQALLLFALGVLIAIIGVTVLAIVF